FWEGYTMTTTPDLWRNPFIDNTSTLDLQRDGVVAPTNGNQFFAVWTDLNGQDDIIARKFDSLGNPLTDEVNLTGPIDEDVSHPAAVRLPIPQQADGLAVAFEFHFSADNHDIYLVRTFSDLNPQDPTPIIVDKSDSNEHDPSITSFSNGSLWVAYTQDNGSEHDILAKR